MNLAMQNNNNQESIHSKITSKKIDVNAVLRQAKKILATGQWQTAINYCREYLNDDYSVDDPSLIPVSIVLSQAFQQNSQFDEMLLVMEQTNSQGFNHWLVDIRLAECLIYCGKIGRAIKWLDQLTKRAKKPERIKENLQVLAKLAELYLHCSQHQKVVECHQTALAVKPQDPQIQYNLAAAKLFLGEIENAEQLLDNVIEKFPGDFDAYYNLSSLKRQTKNNNHIQQLKMVYQQTAAQPSANIAIGYSLAKEYEDLQDYKQSFNYLKQAASKRRANMKYQVKTDTDAMDTIRRTFSKTNLLQHMPSENKATPIFILGLPRSGTTLVEKILSSHRQVGSLGEVSHLAFSLIHTVGPHLNKQDLIEKSLHCDLSKLGFRYTHAIQGYGLKEQYLIDKTPLNFLYIGLIKKAIPDAKIIHLKRHPMDSCFAMYKTLFRMGYPFSYDLGDLAKYYIAYDKLMNHWQDCFAEEILTIDYDQLVATPKSVIEKMQGYCQLAAQADLIHFHKNNSPSSTASAAQVRQPIYQSSVNKWRRYANELASLKEQLSSAGICCD